MSYTTTTTNTGYSRWHSVQRSGKQVFVTRKSGLLPQPEVGYARLAMVSASICGADVRVAKGDKDAHRTSGAAVVMGHEGCGVVASLPEGSPTALLPGQFCVVLPHIHVPADRASGCTRTTQQIEVACTSRHHTDHAGWDFDGVFTDSGVFPLDNLVPVPAEQLARAEEQAPELGRALFTITEPLLCCLSAYELMGREVHQFVGRDLRVGRALVVGCGPIGIIHGIIMAERGYDVSFFDVAPQRARLAQYCLGGGGRIFDPGAEIDGEFDLVMVTANVLPAIRLAEAHVRDEGVIYLFAGLNAADRHAMHPDGVFSYETLHRLAQGVVTRTGDKRVLYVGHSGYYAQLAPKAVALVSANAARLDRVVTGVIREWESPVITSRVPGLDDWRTPDGSPAVIAALTGQADLRQHGKLVILAQGLLSY